MHKILSALMFAALALSLFGEYSINVTNPNITAVTARVVLHKEGYDDDYAAADIAPGDTRTFSGLYDVDYLRLQYLDTRPGSDLVGNSYVSNGETPGWLNFGAETYDAFGGAGTMPLLTGGRSPTPDAAKTLWMVTDDTLTADLFREGIDKVVAGAATGGGSGGMTSDQFAGTNTEAVAGYTKYVYDHPLSVPNMNTDSTVASMQGAANTALAEALNARGVMNMGTVPGGSSGVLAMEIPHLGTLDFDPTHHAMLAAIFAWIKAAIAWFIVYKFEIWLWNYYMDGYKLLALAAPAKGNPVVGGTGAQGTSLIVAVAITGAIATFPVAFWALADSGYTWAAGIATNPMEATAGNTYLETGMYLANTLFPVGTALAAAAASMVIYKGGLLILGATHTVIRFFVA